MMPMRAGTDLEREPDFFFVAMRRRIVGLPGRDKLKGRRATRRELGLDVLEASCGAAKESSHGREPVVSELAGLNPGGAKDADLSPLRGF